MRQMQIRKIKVKHLKQVNSQHQVSLNLQYLTSLKVNKKNKNSQHRSVVDLVHLQLKHNKKRKMKLLSRVVYLGQDQTYHQQLLVQQLKKYQWELQ